MKKSVVLLLLLSTMVFLGCEKYPVNPHYPNAIVDFTINLNQNSFYNLRTVGGYEYLTSDPESTSRGIIVYRVSNDEFRAYDRLPPNYPNACCDDQGNCTRMVVEDHLWVVDHCNNAYYNILNGDIIISEEYDMVPTFRTDTTVYPLIQYHTNFNGYELRVYN